MTPQVSDEDLTLLEVARNYAVILAVGAAISWAARRLVGVDAVRAMLAYGGTVFVLAGMRRPNKLFLTFSSLAEFPLLPSWLVQGLLGVLGIGAIAVALIGP